MSATCSICKERYVEDGHTIERNVELSDRVEDLAALRALCGSLKAKLAIPSDQVIRDTRAKRLEEAIRLRAAIDEVRAEVQCLEQTLAARHVCLTEESIRVQKALQRLSKVRERRAAADERQRLQKVVLDCLRTCSRDIHTVGVSRKSALAPTQRSYRPSSNPICDRFLFSQQQPLSPNRRIILSLWLRQGGGLRVAYSRCFPLRLISLLPCES